MRNGFIHRYFMESINFFKLIYSIKGKYCFKVFILIVFSIFYKNFPK